MSIGVSEASLSDIAAVTNRNDGYGNGDGMWGNNAWQKSATLQGDLH